MKEGDLVTIRLKETGNMRLLLPGLIVATKQAKKRIIYCVHAGGETHWVTDNDLGPFDMSVPVDTSKLTS
jgi:hypothetical protein